MDLKLIKKLCSYQELELEKILLQYLKEKKYTCFYKQSKYIFAEGDLPICLVAHMDTVFNDYFINDFYYDSKRKVLWNPFGGGFDDRAGIYAIIKIIEYGYKPSIIFTNEEERGGIGAYNLITDYQKSPLKIKTLIELDRANQKDAVYYSYDNFKFRKYINKFGFKTEIGIFSDISIISPVWKIPAVNLSIGYEEEHTRTERLHCDWCDQTIEKVKIILNNSTEMPFFSYK